MPRSAVSWAYLSETPAAETWFLWAREPQDATCFKQWHSREASFSMFQPWVMKTSGLMFHENSKAFWCLEEIQEIWNCSTVAWSHWSQPHSHMLSPRWAFSHQHPRTAILCGRGMSWESSFIIQISRRDFPAIVNCNWNCKPDHKGLTMIRSPTFSTCFHPCHAGIQKAVVSPHDTLLEVFMSAAICIVFLFSK